MTSTLEPPIPPSAPPVSADRVVLHVRPILDLTDDQFYAFCRQNPDLRIEQTAEGEWIIMPPTRFGAGSRNSEIARQLGNWARQDGTGATADSSTVFILPNGARLGWLLDTPGRRVFIYRPGQETETLDAPSTVSADPELPGFTLDLALIWDPDF